MYIQYFVQPGTIVNDGFLFTNQIYVCFSAVYINLSSLIINFTPYDLINTQLNENIQLLIFKYSKKKIGYPIDF
jgi:hypothetical protein